MAYPNRLGEFVAPFDRDDWAKHVRWNERRPVATRGLLNPWEVERIRAVWEQEKATWPKIETLKREYGSIEIQMQKDVSTFNSHLAELERITKKKVGLGPIGTYGGMALAVIPGFGWFSAAFTAFSMGLEMLMGNKKKKRINQLIRIMEEAQRRLESGQKRLIAIQDEIRLLMGVTDQAKQAVEAKRRQDLEKMEQAGMMREQVRQQNILKADQERERIRQMFPNRVQYQNDL